jgi:hypothetical protein
MKQMQRVLLIFGILLFVAACGRQGDTLAPNPTKPTTEAQSSNQITSTAAAPTATQAPPTAVQPTATTLPTTQPTAPPTALPIATATTQPTALPAATSAQIAPTEQPTANANAAASPVAQATAPSLAPGADQPPNQRARADLAQRLSRSVDEIQVISVEEDSYPISALNCGTPGAAKPAQGEAAGLTIATRVVLRIDNQDHTYYVQQARMSYCPPL